MAHAALEVVLANRNHHWTEVVLPAERADVQKGILLCFHCRAYLQVGGVGDALTIAADEVFIEPLPALLRLVVHAVPATEDAPQSLLR